MIQRGVRQGCILPPSLFNLYSEYLLQEAIYEKSGILINGVNINTIRYADDTVILAESEEQLQAVLDRIVDKCKEYGMEINAKKTKTMHVGRDTKALTITVGNAMLDLISKYSYLGHMMTEDVATLKRYKYGLKRQGKSFGRTNSC
ncbi:endonuclease-reverse transcriptase [Elysia marginata]|uniref:Endonuclease-reverse transcriptase n=1 Tax=Elysia marginata TaxID=1093978 RepID=A0AAV4EKP5_9GAST|nr:endonuclease-reverse transcriptase [Elysia marginata]